jgi:hypothetical protein
MARSLYRFYLYAIFIALIFFAVSATAQLLMTLFTFTTLRGAYDSVPSQAALVQSLVFAVVGWIISGGLGGLHYWLIRRDLQSDPAAGTSPIRALFLNGPEAIGMLLIVPLVGFGLIQNWAFNSHGNVTFEAGVAVPTLAMVALLEWERRRIPAQRGAALVFQRLHFFGVQLILLFFLISAFSGALRPLINNLFFGGKNECDAFGYCPSYNLAGLALLLLWFALFWLIYGLLTRQDSSRLVRMIMHGASLAFGFGLVLYGVFLALKLALSPVFKISVGLGDVLGSSAGYDFVSPLLTGILITAIYLLLLRNLSRQGLIELQARRLTEWAIATALLAGTFWAGCGYLLYALLQTVAPAPTGPDSQLWTTTLALIITGLAYIPLDLSIRWRFRLDPAATVGPRRGLVLALLGASVLALAIGGAVALYTWLTALLGSPLTNWPQVAHGGLAATIVGVLVAGIYLWTTRGEHLFTRQPRPVQPPAPAAPISQASIESILDDLLAGKITREQAAAQLRALTALPALLT